ncbi:MAG: hypothetical protein N2596_00320 [Syntrophorhabdaceae bacterium]|nr:hypothetical protein [Syntrophorhabdaceae bacterium]
MGVAEEKERELIRFDFKVKIFLISLFMCLSILTALRINGSSIEMINILLKIKGNSNILLGTPKPIRVDEWAITTPAILSQYNSKERFPVTNYSLGYGKTPLFMNVPVKHWTTFFRPQYWPFFFIDIERAFAFYWNMKMVFLLGGVFLLLMLLTNNNFILSLFGAFWLFFSGYIQWWYSSPQMWPEMIGCFAIVTISLIYIFLSNKIKEIFIASITFIFFFN